MEWILIIVGVLVVVGLFVMGTYNSLVVLRNRAKDQWAQVDVQLKKRFDLIPNLVETVKGYAKHEKSTFEEVIEARNKFNSANTPEQEMQAAGELNGVISRLFALAEAYPELKADKNFLQLQNDLKDTEEKIAYARQFYNDSVLNYINKLQIFPSNIIANMFNFKELKFFEVAESEKEAPKVTFTE